MSYSKCLSELTATDHSNGLYMILPYDIHNQRDNNESLITQGPTITSFPTSIPLNQTKSTENQTSTTTYLTTNT